MERQERTRQKAALREQRRLEKSSRGARDPNEDPDLAGIVPGPQPPLPEFR